MGVILAALPARGESTKEELMAASDFRQIVQTAKQKVFPAVVFIRVLSENYESGRKQNVESTGSGVIVSEDGRVLTNWHVIDNAVEIRCLLFDGRAATATIVGSDKDTDLALLQLESKPTDPKFPFAQIGDSDKLTEGDFVMAMGAPWGLSRSVSIGIISCTRRYLTDVSEYNLFLQTDASISPGNSGGPLVDTEGRVVGLNSRGAMQGGDLGFAIPASTLKTMLPRLAEFGAGNWAYTGIRLQPLRDFTRDMYFDGTDGVIVAQAEPNSPAADAGVQTRDRILKINGKSITALTEEDLPAVRERLALAEADKPMELLVRRGAEELTLKVTPRIKGKTQGEQKDFPRWDFTAASINQFDNADLYFHRKQGVFVKGIKQPGNAVTSGLQPNDIVLRIGQGEIKSLEELTTAHQAAMTNVDKEHRILLTVLRNGMMRQVVLDFSRDYAKQ
jgi:serine protease Do